MSNRLHGLDIARYLAFFGMVIVNFKIVVGAEHDLGVLASMAGILEGRAAATFVVLAGIGLGLAAAKRLQKTISVTIKRAVFLMILGLVNTTVFDADILHYYAIYFLLGVVLLPLGAAVLIPILVGVILAFVGMILTLNYDAGWDWETYSYSGFWTGSGFVRNLFFNGWHPVFPWLGFLIFGIILSRQTLAERATQKLLILWGGAVVIAAQGISMMLTPILTSADPELGFIATTSPIPPMPLYMISEWGQQAW